MATQSIVYLAKANDDLVSFCKCPDAPITFPGQASCPWCGCGWLFSCIQCRKSFTFARGIVLTESWQDLIRRDLINFGIKAPSQAQIDQRFEIMQKLLANVKVGEKYVYLDGAVIPADAKGVQFAGRHARHDFNFVPQVEALKSPSVQSFILENQQYWNTNAVSHTQEAK